MYCLLTLGTLFLTVQCHSNEEYKPWTEAEWVDEVDAEGEPINMDIFFDRAVLIGTDNNTQAVTSGVFVTEKIILTSYNPFREYFREPLLPETEEDMWNSIVVIVLTKRYRNKELPRPYGTYTVIRHGVKCARQVIPVLEKSLPPTQWHGLKKKHSPLHDLLVLRVSVDTSFLNPTPGKYAFDDYSNKRERNAGPILTSLANLNNTLMRNVKFASYGFLDKEHIKKGYQLRSREYEEDDNIIEECDEWLPRAWGHFICISNVDHYKGIGSGALLISNNTLFGVGSFMLKKGNNSVLVFTDVRPYYVAILNTCLTS